MSELSRAGVLLQMKTLGLKDMSHWPRVMSLEPMLRALIPSPQSLCLSQHSFSYDLERGEEQCNHPQHHQSTVHRYSLMSEEMKAIVLDEGIHASFSEVCLYSSNVFYTWQLVRK